MAEVVENTENTENETPAVPQMSTVERAEMLLKQDATIREKIKSGATLDEAVHALFEEGNPVGVKCALAEMGKIGPTMRLPLVEGSPALREKFRNLIRRYDLC